MRLCYVESNSSVSVTSHNQTHVRMNFSFSQRPMLSPPKMLTSPIESPCINGANSNTRYFGPVSSVLYCIVYLYLFLFALSVLV